MSYQYVTLVAFGGTPVRLANQSGAPLPTTGSGALVFANGPTLTNPTIEGATWDGDFVIVGDASVSGELTAGTLGVGTGGLAGGSQFSVNDYGYIGSPYAQDPTYLGGINIASITKANPGLLTTTAPHGLSTGATVTISMPSGMTQLNGVTTTITVASSTSYYINVNTTSYSTYTDYATNHGRSAPSGTNLAECIGLTIRTDTAGGGGIVLRNRLYTGLMFINFANDAGDIEGGMQGNSTGNTTLSGARSFNLYHNYGNFGIWGGIQATPINHLTILGAAAGASEGFTGIGTTAPTDMLTLVGVDNALTFATSIYRANLGYGVRLFLNGATGNSGVITVGAGAQFSITAGGVTVANFLSTAASFAVPLLLPPVTAPSSPATGWAFYTDAGDSNKLKAKASTGTVVTLGTP